MIRRPPRSPLFPSPTLFRSHVSRTGFHRGKRVGDGQFAVVMGVDSDAYALRQGRTNEPHHIGDVFGQTSAVRVARSEEHTSELQSQSNLVCRLLLEKKNIT